MKKTLSFILAGLCTLSVATFAHAQTCSVNDTAALEECVASSTEACRSAAPACNGYKTSLSQDDVRILAITNCCGKKKKKARKACFSREQRRYKAEVRSGSQGAFLKEAIKTVKDVSKNICKNDTYTLPADSSLF